MYLYSGENLVAIIRGLDINATDNVIAICSVGAQPIAILEHIHEHGKVVAIDYKEVQLSIAKENLAHIINGDYSRIDAANIAPRHEGYFLDRNRISRIRANSHKIDFKLMDVSKDYDFNEQFSKGYFSNANPDLKLMHKMFCKGGLVYLSAFPWRYDTDMTRHHDCENDIIEKMSEIDKYNKLLKGWYMVDNDLTMLARDIESRSERSFRHHSTSETINTSWKPVVLRVT